MLTPIGVSFYFLAHFLLSVSTYTNVYSSNLHYLSFAEMEVGRQKALVRQLAVAHKQQQKEGASTSTSKVVAKGASKLKNEGKDDRPHKKGPSTPIGDKQPKQSSPPKPNHRVGKGLMIGMGPVTQGAVHCLLTHKEHAIEMVESIIKETDLDPYAKQTIEDLRASGLFDLSRVCFFLRLCSYMIFCPFFY